MKTVYKGQPGYTRYRKKRLLTATITGFLMVVIIFAAGYMIFQTPKNYVTVFAILAVLPTVKIFVQYIMVPWKNNASLEVYKRLSETASPLHMYCELIITAQEKTFEVLYLLVDKNENIIAYTENMKSDEEKFEKGITNFLNYYNFDAKVKLYKDFNQFEKKVKTLSSVNKALTPEQQEHIEQVFEKLSIMSI